MEQQSLAKRTKSIVSVGTIGTVGHGKSTLTAAITTVLAKQYGGTVDTVDQTNNASRDQTLSPRSAHVSHVEYCTASRKYTHVDCPGPSDYVKGLINGDIQLDAAIFVVDATTGPMVPIWQYIAASTLAGVPYMIVFLNKCDLVDDKELLELIEADIRDSLGKYDYPGDDLPVIHGSALKALEGDEVWTNGILKLVDRMDSYIPQSISAVEIPPLMPVENGKPCIKFIAEMYIFSANEGGRCSPISRDYCVQFYIRTTNTTGRIERFNGEEMVTPGSHIKATVELISPIVLVKEIPFIIHEDEEIIGQGTITELYPYITSDT